MTLALQNDLRQATGTRVSHLPVRNQLYDSGIRVTHLLGHAFTAQQLCSSTVICQRTPEIACLHPVSWEQVHNEHM